MGWCQNFDLSLTSASKYLCKYRVAVAVILCLELNLDLGLYRDFANMGMLASIFTPKTISRIQLLKGHQVTISETSSSLSNFSWRSREGIYMFVICNLSWNAVIGVTDNSQSSTIQGNQMVAGSSLPGNSDC